jgi:hypothetical protein
VLCRRAISSTPRRRWPRRSTSWPAAELYRHHPRLHIKGAALTNLRLQVNQQRVRALRALADGSRRRNCCGRPCGRLNELRPVPTTDRKELLSRRLVQSQYAHQCLCSSKAIFRLTARIACPICAQWLSVGALGSSLLTGSDTGCRSPRGGAGRSNGDHIDRCVSCGLRSATPLHRFDQLPRRSLKQL